jgi:hypothetical protein
MPRSYVSSYGPDPAAVRTGLAWLQVIGRSALLAVPQKSNLEGTIEGVIGLDAIKALSRGETVRFGTVPLSLATERAGRRRRSASRQRVVRSILSSKPRCVSSPIR